MAFENDQADLMHDVRLIRHHIRRNLLSDKDHEKYLASLDDVGEHGVETDTRFANLWDQDREEGQDD